jgi:hypothetical protein
MSLTGHIAEAFHQQGEVCRRMGSPFTGHLCERLVAILDRETVLGRAAAGWPLDPWASALALRLCGALNMLRSGLAPELGQLYPPDQDMGPALDAALCDAVAKHGEVLVALLESAPQTNEVARSGVLLGGLLIIAHETGLPLALNELAASAGVNLHVDCYGYDLGQGRRWGPVEALAPLTIRCDWRGPCPPLDAPLRVTSRAGSDLAPIDPADSQARARMLAYIWPDQPERLARTVAALDHAAAHGPVLECADAADWVEQRLAEPQQPGMARVFMHSIAWQYFPGPVQDRICATLARAGADATPDTPLAWLRLEADGTPGTAAVLLNLWTGDPAGGKARELGRGDYHGRFAEWNSASGNTGSG